MTQVTRVVQQLQSRPFFLFQYLDALFERDPHLSSSFADMQVGPRVFRVVHENTEHAFSGQIDG